MINTAHDADGSLSMSSCNWNITDYTPSEGDPEYNVRQSLGRALEEWRKDVVGCFSVFIYSNHSVSEQYVMTDHLFTPPIAETRTFRSRRPK
jgi:hypothetical protein